MTRSSARLWVLLLASLARDVSDRSSVTLDDGAIFPVRQSLAGMLP
jgi:hypothetical protein